MFAEVAEVVEVRGRNGTIVFDGRTITIVRKGFIARATVGKGQKQIPLGNVTAVQFKPSGPMFNGFIQFTLGGGNEGRSAFGRQTFDTVKDENTVMFDHRHREKFEQLRDVIQTAIADHQRGSGEQPVGVPEQIRQLAELRDLGVLTRAEFEEKKSELLRRM